MRCSCLVLAGKMAATLHKQILWHIQLITTLKERNQNHTQLLVLACLTLDFNMLRFRTGAETVAAAVELYLKCPATLPKQRFWHLFTQVMRHMFDVTIVPKVKQVKMIYHKVDCIRTVNHTFAVASQTALAECCFALGPHARAATANMVPPAVGQLVKGCRPCTLASWVRFFSQLSAWQCA